MSLDNKYVKQIEQGEEHLKGPEWAAKAVLTGLNFKVHEVPRNSGKTPDFLVDGDSPAYVVEVASRYISEKAWGEPVTLDQTWDAKMLEWLREAGKQCRAIDASHERLWIIWGSAEGPIDPRGQLLRIRNTLFGVRSYLEIVPPHREVLACYARPPLFESFPDIDGMLVFVDDEHGLATGLLPNEFSPRSQALRESKLAKSVKFAPPEVHVANGGCIVPATVDRRSESDVLKYVQRTLGIPMLTPLVLEKSLVAGIRIPRDELERE